MGNLLQIWGSSFGVASTSTNRSAVPDAVASSQVFEGAAAGAQDVNGKPLLVRGVGEQLINRTLILALEELSSGSPTSRPDLDGELLGRAVHCSQTARTSTTGSSTAGGIDPDDLMHKLHTGRRLRLATGQKLTEFLGYVP